MTLKNYSTMTKMNTTGRRWLLGACMGMAALWVSGCSEKPPFHGIDITGADYAQILT